MTLKLTFHGAAGCVTGFCALLETDRARLLIDCGMFQGSKTLKALNYGDFPFDAAGIDTVLLTHAHIDHSGLLPKLMKAGFRGPIHATAGTRDLCEIMLADSASIQESEVRQLNRRNQRRGRAEVKPIYTVRDAARCLEQFSKVKLGEPVQVAPGVTAIYWEAGHILGSSSIELRVETDAGVETLLFSGDLGPGGREYAADPQGPSGVDYLIMESTYGDRERADLGGDARRSLLAKELNDAHHAGGPLLIPAFAVERSQELLADLMTLMDERRVPQADIFLDSPLAIEATEIFQQRGWNRATKTNPFEHLSNSGRLKFLREPGESDRLETLSGWHIIMAASGMCDAGRVRKHLKRLLWRRQATVLLSGYQAAGTLGRILQEGARRVSIQGEDIQVHARIRALDVYSGHADAPRLVTWAKQRGPVAGVFLAHGEPASLEGLKSRLAAGGVPADKIKIPTMDEAFVLERGGAAGGARSNRRIAPDAAARADWHNARAQLLMELNQRLEAAPDDRARERLITQLAAALGNPTSRDVTPKPMGARIPAV
jgi:metallo-beta-lactamase family protein